MKTTTPLEIWGGLEATINRVHDEYLDQSEFSGHYKREGDIDLVASLGISMVRYPVLWERHQAAKDTVIDWSFAERNLARLKEAGVTPIAGLVHHGSGPDYVNFFDGSFEAGVAQYARMVAEKFPWLEYYTPINEPLTTARFCGLYGHWYPHKRDDFSFYTILVSECKAVVMAMKAIREVNPNAKLVQTEDLGKTYSTPLLKYQADFENKRRWISYDLLFGKVDERHPLWYYLTDHVGIPAADLLYFKENHCVPDVCGFNYYITSERYLDEDISRYPAQTHGGNGKHRYADVEAVRVLNEDQFGLQYLLKEAYDHLKQPLAITECHLHCTREEQMRWFYDVWQTVSKLKAEGIDIKALTAWALFGSYGWDTLVTQPNGTYEPGVFNLGSGVPKATGLARLIKSLTNDQSCSHPVLHANGWWRRETRIHYPSQNVVVMKDRRPLHQSNPLIIVGKDNCLSTALRIICADRYIHAITIAENELATDDVSLDKLLEQYKPWAIINTAAYSSSISDDQLSHFAEATVNRTLAGFCCRHQVRFCTFSSHQVFDGDATRPYQVADEVAPINETGKTYSAMEIEVLAQNPSALVIRTGDVFTPWNGANFVTNTLATLKQNRKVTVPGDITVSFTYAPDLIHPLLDMLLDDEQGIVHVANTGETTLSAMACKIAGMAGRDQALVVEKTKEKLKYKAPVPKYTALQNSPGLTMPPLEGALRHYFETGANVYVSDAIAV